MADSPDSSSAWPSSPGVLADVHVCPGCFTQITLPECPVCGFVLTDPRALEVLQLGRTIVAAESDRQRIIEAVRLDYRRAPAEAVPAEPAFTPAPSSVTLPTLEPTSVPVGMAEPIPPSPLLEQIPAAVVVSTPVPTAEPVPVLDAAVATAVPPEPIQPPAPVQPPATVAPPQPAPEPRAPRRRLSVPVLLLIVGVSLVGVAAVFFLVYAWFTWGIAVRALIIGAITVATIAIASLLRRRSLTATAEGIAVLGVILLALDAWAVRANDFFGTAQVEPALYYGFAVLAVGLLCRVWARLSRLRGPDIAAVLALPVGVGLIVGGATSLPAGEATVAGLLGAAAGGLVHALPAPWSSARSRADAVPERTTLAIIGVAALLAAAVVAAYTSLDDIALPLWSGLAIILLGATHAFLLRPRADAENLPAAAILMAVSSSTAAAVATLIGWQLALRSDLPIYTLLVGPVIAVAVPVLLDRLRARAGDLIPARITATVLGALSLTAALVIWLVAAVTAIAPGWTAWQTDAVAPASEQVDGASFAAIAGILIALALFLAPTLGRPVLKDVRIIVAAVVLLTGVSVVAIPALLVGTAALTAVVAVVGLTRPTLRIGAGVSASLGAVTAFAAGTATPWLWLIGVAVAIGVPIAAQLIVRPVGSAAGWLSFAPVGVATIAAFLAPGAIGAVAGTPPNPSAAFVLVQWVALAAVLAAVFLRLQAGSRTALAATGFALFVVSLLPYAAAAIDGGLGGAGVLGATVSGTPANLGEPALGMLRASALLVLFALIALRRTRVAAVPALVAAALVPAAASLLTFSVVQTLGLEDHGARALATVGATVTVVWVAAVWSMLRLEPKFVAAPVVEAPDDREPVVAPALPGIATRTVVDLGALVAALTLVWDVPIDLRWAMLALIGAGFVGASITRGWAAPLTASLVGVPSTRTAGIPLPGAPRRLLAWPAFAFATAALWSGLSTGPTASSLTVEAYALPPAIGLLVFAAVLVWLRRHAEAAVAISASFLLGLCVPALAGWTGSPARGTVVAIVAAAVCLLLSCTPAVRARIPALAGATTALLALALVALERAVDGPPAQIAWLLLLLGVAYASATGAAFAVRRWARRSWYAVIVPPVAVAAATAAGILSSDLVPVLTIALVVLAGLHLAASAIGRDPFGVATRWTGIVAAAAFAAAGFVGGAAKIDDVAVIELVTVPVALMVLAGSALAQWRARREGHLVPDGELFVWLAGLVIAVLPSVVAPVESLRVWLVVVVPLAVALVAVLVPIPGLRTLRMWSAIVLTAGALAMGARTLAVATFASSEAAVITAGFGALVVAAGMIWTAPRPDVDTDTGPRVSDAVSAVTAAVGAALLVAAVIVLSDGELPRTTLTVLIAAVGAVGGAALLGSHRWRSLGAILAIAGFVGALVAIGARLIIIVDSAGTSIEPDLWAVIALGITAAIGVMALRATTGTAVSEPVAIIVGVGLSAGLLFFTAVEWLLLGADGGDDLRTVVTMSTLTIAGFGGVLMRWRLGLTPPVTAAITAAVFGVAALLLYGVTPVELVTVPPALGLIALGARALRRTPRARTWPALGPGLALLTVPSLLHDFIGDTDLWRVVALGIVAIALVVIGAVWRLQAPLVLGSVVLLIHGIAQLWPWISSTYVYVPWWLWLGIGGALLIYLAARYESSMRALRTSFTAVASLR